MARGRSAVAGPDPSSPRPRASEAVRTCVGCRARATKSELLRVTAGRDAAGQPAVVPDPASTASGRGAHVHPTRECVDLAVRRKAFSRALRAGTGLPTGLVSAYVDSLTSTTSSTSTT
ncbi:YlxR family protein [Nocardioides alkalitolerans]|uniref:YlxR family protein n=1 Tax=Nocardioides alkalitolerans TaxID=281714 RepID=UPI0009FEC396|nr:YlxR family protein [Nocardioides alkalitolerans]